MTDNQKLLADYVESGSEVAFGELVARYLDLVYSAAVRLMGGDTHRAEDVVQIVFADLACRARTLSPQVMLGGWLHRRTCHVAATLLRSERRRQSRERVAVEMNALQDHSETNLAEVAPILDEAINQLNAPDRTAILLRFFEQSDFRAIGRALDSNEDAAQKRVSRALEKLRNLLSRRGVTLTATALACVLTAKAVTVAPANLGVGVAAASLAAARTVSIFTLLKFAAAAQLKTAVIAAMIIACAVAPLAIQHQANVKLRDQSEALRIHSVQLTQLQAENTRLSNLLARAAGSQRLPDNQLSEMLKLRDEIRRLRAMTQELTQAQAHTNRRPSREEMLASMARQYAEQVGRLRDRLQANPAEMIPEFTFLSDSDWRDLANQEMADDDDGFRKAASMARGWAENRLVNDVLHPALQQFAKDNNGQLPSQLSALKPYFTVPVDEAVLRRWEIVPANDLADYMASQALSSGEDRLIALKAPINPELDMPTVCGLNKVTAFASRPANKWVRSQ
jgi:RNA polymerase sigma factor (sigma-70 family)